MNQTLYLYKGFQFLQKIDIACIFMNKDFKIILSITCVH